MFELVFLLLPVAAAYGYYMGKNSVKNEQAQTSSERTRNYLRGVDYFLNHEQDQAIDKFIAYLDSSDPTFESTLALGNVFRQRGEVDRAISLHSSLANNENVEPFESELARIELANDFISAGLLDRAEYILLELIDIPDRRKSAVELLLKLYEQERDFEKAIELGLSYKDSLNSSCLNQLSHYYCELAQSKLINSKYKEVELFLNQGLECSKNSIRIRLLQGELCLKQKPEHYELRVIHLALEVARIDNSTGVFALELLNKCFIPQNRNKEFYVKKNTDVNTNNSKQAVAIYDQRYIDSLKKLMDLTHSAAVIIEYCNCLIKTGQKEQAQSIIMSFLKERPNLKLFSALMALRSKDLDSVESSEVIMQLKSIVDAQVAAHNLYLCSRCGFESSIMFWQCPSCRRWDSIRIKHSIDSD